MKRLCANLFSPYLLLALTISASAEATTIDFEAQAVNRGGNLTGVPDSPLGIGVATFGGGELLRGEAGLNADITAIYASQGLFGSGETNPLTISFSVPIENFSVQVLNGDDMRNYTLSDDLGDTITKSLASAGGLGSALLSLPGSGITRVSIASANADAWDFAIDNVTFTSAIATPEPGSMLLLSAGCLFLFTMCRNEVGVSLLNRTSRFKRLLQSLTSRANSARSDAFTSDTAQ